MSIALIETDAPTQQDRLNAAEAVERLSDGQLDLSQLPEIVKTLLNRILVELANGRAVSVVPIEADMTTSEAADYLNVSRPYLIRLLNEEKIPFHHVGSHKRVSFHAVKHYKEEQKKRSYAALAELQAEAQELNMGY